MHTLRHYWGLFRDAGRAWSSDHAPSMGAALAFYSAFAIAPLLLVVTAVAGVALGDANVRAALVLQMQDAIGPAASEAVRRLLDAWARLGTGAAATLLGLLLLLIGASTVVIEMQNDLDLIWRAPKRANEGFWPLLRARLLAFVLIVALGALLTLSLLIVTAINALAHHLPVFAEHEVLIRSVHLLLSLAVFTLAFAMLYKWLPNVRLGWRDVWWGAAVTSLLFTLGQLPIGYYLGHSTTTSAYAAAAALFVLLLWLYYAAQISDSAPRSPGCTRSSAAAVIWARTSCNRAPSTPRRPRCRRADGHRVQRRFTGRSPNLGIVGGSTPMSGVSDRVSAAQNQPLPVPWRH